MSGATLLTGLFFGTQITDYIGIGLEGSIVELGFGSPWAVAGVNGTMRNFHLMPNVRIGTNFWNFVNPYIAIGAGLSVWTSQGQYRENGTWSSWHRDTRNTLTYMARAGVGFDITRRTVLDFSIMYQDLGRPKNNFDAFRVVGNVTNIEYRVGMMFRF